MLVPLPQEEEETNNSKPLHAEITIMLSRITQERTIEMLVITTTITITTITTEITTTTATTIYEPHKTTTAIPHNPLQINSHSLVEMVLTITMGITTTMTTIGDKMVGTAMTIMIMVATK